MKQEQETIRCTAVRSINYLVRQFLHCGTEVCAKPKHLECVSLSLAEELFVHEGGAQSSPQVQATGRQHYGGLETPRHADRRQNLALLPAFSKTQCRFVTAAVFHMHRIL